MVSDITGTSARRMLAALIAGKRDPQVLAELALGRMRPKVPDLQRALVGHFTEHHARLCAKMLAHIDDLTATIAELTSAIDTEIGPFHHARIAAQHDPRG
jgi:transposase